MWRTCSRKTLGRRPEKRCIPAQAMDLKFHCYLADQRKGRLKGVNCSQRDSLVDDLSENGAGVGEILRLQVIDNIRLDSLAGEESFELSIEVLQAIEAEGFRVKTILCSGASSEISLSAG